MAINKRGGLNVFLTPYKSGGYTSVYDINSATKQIGVAWQPSFNDSSKTISKVRLRIWAVLGTLGANDLVCTLCQDGVTPGTSIESRNTVTSIPTGSSVVEWTGFTTTINRGTRYWFSFTNENATPATNYPRYFYASGGLNNDISVLGTLNVNGQFGWLLRTYDGSTWGSINICLPIEVEYSDGTVDGNVILAPANSNAVYGTRKAGVLFTPTVALKVRGAFMSLLNQGTPPACSYAIYQGNTQIALTSSNVPASIISANSGKRVLYFDDVVSLSANTAYRLVAAAVSGGGDASNYIKTYHVTQNLSNDYLLDWGIRKTYYDDSSWTDTDSQVMEECGFILDESIATASSSSGSGVSKSRVVNVGGI